MVNQNVLKTPLISLTIAVLSLPFAEAEDAIDFNAQIRPILSNTCVQCHGPDENKRKAKLRLDQPEGVDGAYRVNKGSAAISPGSLEKSELWQRITSTDPDEVMPPSDSHVDALEPGEKALIKRWILEGAAYADFWAFVPPREHAVPTPMNAGWSDQVIDRFVMERIEKAGLQPKARADKRSLIRRVTFDLTGLPPTPEEIHAFLADESTDAYEKLVARLVTKPQYGEHMAKYWLDLVRFADTNGLHHDHYRDMTPYRDWVIRSFNDNVPFKSFIVDQIAGDLHPEPTEDQLIASGFNRLHLIIDVGTALPEESFARNVIDRVASVGTAFMGLTLECAVCHDHKFDPVTQKDFFQMYAFFNNFDGEPETGGRGTPDFMRGLQPPYINVMSPEQKVQFDGIKDAKKRDAYLQELPGAMVMKERAEVRTTHILVRGQYDSPGAEVERGTPGFLPPLEKEGTKTRMDLAQWMVREDNPLTARVAVNRFWQQFFGVGLVKTSEDFGAQGEWPSHPRLLDHLALEFVKSGWDVKALVKSIVLTETYCQSSAAPESEFVNDPGNRNLARGPRFRLDSEMVRDQVLAVCGLLNPEMYGKSVKPPQPEGLWKIVAMPSSYPNSFVADTGGKIYRRSIYTFWKRGLPPPQMTIFDAPTREACIARRERTNTPLQALLMMNEEQYFLASMHLAHTLLQRADLDDTRRLSEAYEILSSQLPGDAELKNLASALADFRALYQNDNAAAAADMLGASNDEAVKAVSDPAARAELAAWTMIVHSLFNLDSTKTRE